MKTSIGLSMGQVSYLNCQVSDPVLKNFIEHLKIFKLCLWFTFSFQFLQIWIILNNQGSNALLSVVGYCTAHKQLMDGGPLYFGIYGSRALPIPQHLLLPAVTSCCQNFSDAVTLDFCVIHSRSASFSSFNCVYFATHLTEAQVQCWIILYHCSQPIWSRFWMVCWGRVESTDPSADVKTSQL